MILKKLLKKSKKKNNQLVTIEQPKSSDSEQYRNIYTNLMFKSNNHKLKSFTITSAGINEGRTTSAGNIAVIAASDDKKVLLVDGNIRNPQIDKYFDLHISKGLHTYLERTDTKLIDCIYDSKINNLSILPSYVRDISNLGILDTKRIEQLLVEAYKLFDIIIFDTPSILLSTDAQIIAAQTDATILVIREGVTVRRDMLHAKSLLEIAKANIIGFIYTSKK